MRNAAALGVPGHALLLHGAGAWGGQWAIWRRVLEADGWQVATPDLQSAPGGIAATTLDDYRTQVWQLAAQQPGGFLLVGASLAGLLALALANDLAASSSGVSADDGPLPRPAGLVLVNPLPPAPFASELPRDAEYDSAIRPWHSHGRFDSTRHALPGASFVDQRIAFLHWRDESAAVLRQARAGLALPNLATALTRLPTLVIASSDDTNVPPLLSMRFADSVGASLLRVRGGHVEPVMGASAAATAHSALAWWATVSG